MITPEQDPWERLRHLFRSAHESMSFTAPEELLSTTVGYLNEISRAAEACGIGRSIKSSVGEDLDAFGPWANLGETGVGLDRAVRVPLKERVGAVIQQLNEISRAAEACGIGKIEAPPGAYDAIKSAIEALAKSPHPPHATAMSVLLRVLPVLEDPTLANEAKMMNVLGVMSRRHEEGTG